MQQVFETLAHEIMERYRRELSTYHTHSLRMRLLEEMRNELLSLKRTYSEVLGQPLNNQQFADCMKLPVFNA